MPGVRDVEQGEFVDLLRRDADRIYWVANVLGVLKLGRLDQAMVPDEQDRDDAVPQHGSDAQRDSRDIPKRWLFSRVELHSTRVAEVVGGRPMMCSVCASLPPNRPRRPHGRSA